MSDVSGVSQGLASAWGWTFRGSQTASTSLNGAHFEVAGSTGVKAEELIHVDALGRVKSSVGLHARATVSLPVATPVQAGIEPVLRSALSATVDLEEMRSPVRTLLALFVAEVESNAVDRRTFAFNASFAGRGFDRAGDRESTHATDGVDSRSVWRGPVLDAALLDDERVLLLRDAELLALEVDESAVWRHAVGVSPSELANRAGLPARAVDGLVGMMMRRGVLSHTAWWRIREDVVWTRRRDEAVFASKLGNDAVPLAIDGWGAVIWEFIASQRNTTTTAIVDHLRFEHGVDEDVSSDVTSFLSEVRVAGLIGC